MTIRCWRQERENSIEGSPPGIKLAWKLMPGGVPFLGVYLSVSNRGVITIFPFSPLRLPPVEAGKQGQKEKSQLKTVKILASLNRRGAQVGEGGWKWDHEVVGQRLTFPFPFVHQQPHDCGNKTINRWETSLWNLSYNLSAVNLVSQFQGRPIGGSWLYSYLNSTYGFLTMLSLQ